MRILAFLPAHEPPPYLTALAALGHDVHLIVTVAGAQPFRSVDGVGVWSTGMWHRARVAVDPQVLMSAAGDRPAAGLVRRLAGVPHLTVGPPAVEDPRQLEQQLLRAIPPGVARDAATVVPPEDPLDGQAVKVVAWMHYGLPHRRAGSEVMLHTMLRALHEHGIGVLAVTSEMPEAPPSWDVDGIPYLSLPYASAAMLIRRIRPHVMVTHHHLSPQAIRLAKEVGARSILAKHNDHREQAKFLWSGPDLVVYNTNWIRESLRADWLEVDRTPSMIVHPPVTPAEHHVEQTGDHVTLVNLSANKGVHTFRAVAELLPALPFLGVIGAHGTQETGHMLANVTVVPHTSNMRDNVWARTRVLLMPSVYESYGMVAVEALASGVPVIAHPTPGLREALGDAGTFIDRSDVQAWADAVRSLYRGGRRRGSAQKAARERSALIADQTTAELKQWVKAVQGLAAR